MPSVILNKKEVEKILGKKISLEELKDRISMLGTDLDKIENDEIHVEIFPNRPDLMSEQGLGRALSSFLGIKTGLKEYKVKKSGYQLFAKDPEDNWPFVLGFMVKNLKLNTIKVNELIQLQEKLNVTFTRNRKKGGIGLYPLDKIKFPVTFTAKPSTSIKFQPLGFKKELTAKEILEQHPKGKTYGHIVNSWKKLPLFLDSNQIIMSMPPIINSEIVGKITENSKDLFVEATGPDMNTLRDALNIIATTLADMGGEIYSLEIVYPKKKFDFPTLEPREMKLELDQVNKYLGLELSEKELKMYLEQMGYSYNNKLVLIPPYRVDILNQVDLIEDIAISYGYEKFKPTIPQVSTIGQEDKFEILKTRIANYLVGFGLLETNSYNLISKEDLKKTLVEIKTIQIKNPVNLEYNTLRTSIVVSLLKILSENKHNEYPQNLFEIGRVFENDQEYQDLGLVLCHDKVTFTDAKQIFDSLMNYMELEYSIEEMETPLCISGRAGQVKVKGKTIAYIGEINPQVLTNFNLTTPVALIEIKLDELFKVM